MNPKLNAAALLRSPLVSRLLDIAVAEDVGTGDITSEGCVGREVRADAWIVARENLVLSGLPLLRPLLDRIDKQVKLKLLCKDGSRVAAGRRVARLSGPARSLLAAERVLLNTLMHLSGIATHTARACAVNPKLQLLDTRKTRPGLRLMEKYAVACGGGGNHRIGLYDAILIKDNHLRAAGGVAAAIAACRRRYPGKSIEVEVESAAQLRAAISARADIILLDNFPDRKLPALLKTIPAPTRIEISGSMTPARLAKLPPHPRLFVSMGFLTHHAVWADMAMDLKLKG